MKKWKVEIMVVVGLLLVGAGVWLYMASADERVAKAEVKAMIDFAQRQALEIAIIEQASKLTDYRRQLAAAKTPPPVNPFAPAPLNPIPVADPKDVPEE